MTRIHLALLVPVLWLVLWLAPSVVRGETLLTLKEGPLTAESPASSEIETSLPEETVKVADVSFAPPVPTAREETESEEMIEEESIADPLEQWNRIVFTFNDRFYYWLFKPVAKGYNAVFPEPVRVSVHNLFDNISVPVRFVNCLLQGKLESAGIELARFTVNSSLGFAGLFDVAKNSLNLRRQEEDTGLTLGFYGIGAGPYIIWPFIGPSSLRDTIGLIGDGFLTPLDYVTPWQDAFALESTDYFTDNALHLGDYEDLTESAIEPYIALRDAYAQHRKSLIRK